MKILFLILSLLSLTFYSCRSVQQDFSQVKENDTPDAGDPQRSQRLGFMRKALYPLVGDDLDGKKEPLDSRCAQSCHVHANLTSNQLVPWFEKMFAVDEKCKLADFYTLTENDTEKAKTMANCVVQNFAQSGLLRAGINSYKLSYLFQLAGMQSEYEKLKRKAMPPPGNAIGHMSAEDFDGVENISWMYTANPEYLRSDIKKILANEGGFGPPKPPLPTCKNYVSPELEQHLTEMETFGWGAKNLLDPNVKMFGCNYGENGNFDAEQCFSDKIFRRKDGSPIFPSLNNYLATNSKSGTVAGAQIKQLKDIGESQTNYWIRTSADGRFIGAGGRGIERLDAIFNGGVDRIQITDSVDPGFFPNNRGFVFQIEGLMVCDQSLLDHPDVLAAGVISLGSMLDEDGFGMSTGVLEGANLEIVKQLCAVDGKVSLYQSVGSGITGRDNFYFDGGSWEGDPGTIYRELPVSSFANKNSSATLFVGEATLKTSSKGNGRISTPNQGDWFLVPSSEYILGREATREENSVHDGYVFRRLKPVIEGEGAERKITSIEAPEEGKVCLTGRKPTISYDESYIATHHYVKAYDYAEYGFQSATDPEFRKIKFNSSDIWIADVLTGKNYRITNVGHNRKAMYPHFRADGWIYFLLVDYNFENPRTSYLATNAVVILKKRNDTQDKEEPRRSRR